MRSHCCQPDSALKLKQRMDRLRFHQKNALCKVSGEKSTSVDELQNLTFQTFSHENLLVLKRFLKPTHLNTDLEHTTHPPAKTKRTSTHHSNPKNSKVFLFAIFRAKQLVSCHYIYSKPFLIMRAMRSWPRLRRCGGAGAFALTGPFPLRATLRRPLSSVASERMGTCAELGCGPSAVSGHSKSGDLLGLTNETLESDLIRLFRLDRNNPQF